MNVEIQHMLRNQLVFGKNLNGLLWVTKDRVTSSAVQWVSVIADVTVLKSPQTGVILEEAIVKTVGNQLEPVANAEPRSGVEQTKGVLRKMRESDVTKKDTAGVTNLTTIPEEHVIVTCVTAVATTRLRPGLLEVTCLGPVLGFLELEWIHRRACPSYWSVLASGASWAQAPQLKDIMCEVI